MFSMFPCRGLKYATTLFNVRHAPGIVHCLVEHMVYVLFHVFDLVYGL